MRSVQSRVTAGGTQRITNSAHLKQISIQQKVMSDVAMPRENTASMTTPHKAVDDSNQKGELSQFAYWSRSAVDDSNSLNRDTVLSLFLAIQILLCICTRIATGSRSIRRSFPRRQQTLSR